MTAEDRGARLHRVDKAELVEVIRVVRCVGEGNGQDPVRLVNEYWSKEGELLAWSDSFDDSAKGRVPVVTTTAPSITA